VTIRKKRRDLALVHPWDGVYMQTGLALAVVAVVPRTLLEPAAVMASPEDEDVALSDSHALRLLRRLELGAGDRVARLEVRHPAQARDVEQHAATHHPVGVRRYVEAVHAFARHFGYGPAVVEQTAIRDVVEGVDVGV